MTLTPPTITDEQIRAASLAAGMQEHYMGFHSGFLRFAGEVIALNNAAWLEMLAGQEPYTFDVYFPNEDRGEFVYALDDLTEGLTNCEHEITKLYTAPVPAQAPAVAVPKKIKPATRTVESYGYANGWNDCLDALTAAQAGEGEKA